MTEERTRLLQLYGAEIVFSPGEQGSNGSVRMALEIAEREPRFFLPFQYANEANPAAHYEGTGARSPRRWTASTSWSRASARAAR